MATPRRTTIDGMVLAGTNVDEELTADFFGVVVVVVALLAPMPNKNVNPNPIKAKTGIRRTPRRYNVGIVEPRHSTHLVEVEAPCHARK
jgi:hypothetical protein